MEWYGVLLIATLVPLLAAIIFFYVSRGYAFVLGMKSWDWMVLYNKQDDPALERLRQKALWCQTAAVIAIGVFVVLAILVPTIAYLLG